MSNRLSKSPVFGLPIVGYSPELRAAYAVGTALRVSGVSYPVIVVDPDTAVPKPRRATSPALYVEDIDSDERWWVAPERITAVISTNEYIVARKKFYSTEVDRLVYDALLGLNHVLDNLEEIGKIVDTKLSPSWGEQ